MEACRQLYRHAALASAALYVYENLPVITVALCGKPRKKVSQVFDDGSCDQAIKTVSASYRS